MKKSYLALIFLLFSLTVRSQCPPVSAISSGPGQFVFSAGSVFVDSSLYGVNWDFGDGSTGFSAIISHAYNAQGTYRVCYTAYDLNTGNTVCTNCDSVVVGSVTNNCNFTYVSNPATNDI